MRGTTKDVVVYSEYRKVKDTDGSDRTVVRYIVWKGFRKVPEHYRIFALGNEDMRAGVLWGDVPLKGKVRKNPPPR